MPGMFPKVENGAVIVRDEDGVCQNPAGVSYAYCPPAEFITTCVVTALPEDCTARIMPGQINAIVSELLCFAGALSAEGPWDCESTCNLATLFETWVTTNVGQSDGVTITGDGSVSAPFSVIPLGVVNAICADDDARDALTECLISDQDGNIITNDGEGRMLTRIYASGSLSGTGTLDDPFDIEDLGVTTDKLADGAVTEEKLAGDFIIYTVTDRAEMKALDTTRRKTSYLKELGREGIFKFVLGDFSVPIAADVAEGIYIKATAVAANVGAWVRVGPAYHIGNFGALADGASNSATAIAAMASLLSYVRFPTGVFSCNTATIEVPVYFDVGASLTVPAAQTVTIRNRIDTPKQQIFKGAGTVRLDITTNNGEDSRMTHASWWGVFPNGDNPAGNQTAAINKMFSSFAQGREGIIDFDSGSYRVTWDGLDPIPRGVWLRGSGIRRTTFDMLGVSTAASKMFRTAGTAGKITGIQFEHPAEVAASGHLGTLISIDHDDWYVDDVRCWDSQFGVALNGNRCEAHNVQSIYGAAVDNSSATVVVRGSGCVVDNVRVNDTSNGPRDIVSVGLGATANVEGVRVSNVRTTENSIGVAVRANNDINVHGIDIDGVMNTGDESSPVLGLVALITTQNGSINNAVLNRLITNGTSAALVRIDQGSTAYTRDIVVASGQAIGSGNGIVLNQTAGSLTDITVSEAVDVDDRTAVVRTGTMSNIKLGQFVGGGSVTIADDGVADIIPPAKGGFFKVKCMGLGDFPNYLCSGEVFYDAVATVNNLKLTGGANFVAVSTTVTGTTGVDGNVTIGIVAGLLKIENRVGQSAVFEFTFG